MPVYHGKPPFLECSSAGDKRLSAFFARIKGRGNKTIEEIYQRAKKFREEDGTVTTGYPVKVAKGLKPINLNEMRQLYTQLWDEYMLENQHLLPVIREATGLADRFGRPGGVCQATELWRIRNTWPLDNTG
jgi:hypothetical protein